MSRSSRELLLLRHSSQRVGNRERAPLGGKLIVLVQGPEPEIEAILRVPIARAYRNVPAAVETVDWALSIRRENEWA